MLLSSWPSTREATRPCLSSTIVVGTAPGGTAPDIAGKNVANPGAVILAACMLLEHIGDDARAARIRTAPETTIRDGTVITRDLGGSATTDQFTDAIIAKL